MIICICNNISEADIEKDESKIKQCGTGCGICLEYIHNTPSLADLIEDKDDN